jgi:hypothetical protein
MKGAPCCEDSHRARHAQDASDPTGDRVFVVEHRIDKHKPVELPLGNRQLQ